MVDERSPSVEVGGCWNAGKKEGDERGTEGNQTGFDVRWDRGLLRDRPISVGYYTLRHCSSYLTMILLLVTPFFPSSSMLSATCSTFWFDQGDEHQRLYYRQEPRFG